MSFLVLGAKCRKCKSKLSFYYPIAELITGLSFIGVLYWLAGGSKLTINNYQLASVLLYWFFIAAILITIFFTDLKYGIIPDRIVFPSIVAVFLYQFIFAGFNIAGLYLSLKNDTSSFGRYLLQTGYFYEHSFLILKPLIYSIVGSIGIFLFFYLLLVLTKGRGIGGGDVKYSLLLGLVSGWPSMVAGVFLSFLTGSAVSLILIALGKKKLKQTIPFGPFLVIGTVLSVLYGDRTIMWYLSLL